MTTNRAVVFTKSARAAIGALGAGLKNAGRFHGQACSSSDQRSAELTAWLRYDRRDPRWSVINSLRQRQSGSIPCARWLSR